jgi:hypothetical protein
MCVADPERLEKRDIYQLRGHVGPLQKINRQFWPKGERKLWEPSWGGGEATDSVRIVNLDHLQCKRAKKWAPKQDKLPRVWSAFDKGKDPLSSEEIHFIQTCCQILKIGSDDMVAFIAATEVNEDGVDPASRPAHCRSQDIFRNTGAEAFRRKSPAPYQTTRNVDSLETHVHSLKHLCKRQCRRPRRGCCTNVSSWE